jgi:hypothetical protein
LEAHDTIIVEIRSGEVGRSGQDSDRLTAGEVGGRDVFLMEYKGTV